MWLCFFEKIPLPWMDPLLNSVFESCALWEKAMSCPQRALTLCGILLCVFWEAKGLAMGSP